MEDKKNRIENVIDTSLKHISEIIDVNTVIGKPILSDDKSVIMPYCSLTMSILSAGGEYGKSGLFKPSNNLPFSAGNSSIVSIKPLGFIVKKPNGNIEVMTTNMNKMDKIIDIVCDNISSFNKETNEKN